jgi:PPOX class probable F420-dependent enzyme
MELSARAIEVRIECGPRAVLATLRANGSAALVPVVFARAGGALWSPIDGKPKRGPALARLANIARDARVALLLDGYDANWAQLWWLRVEGRASAVRAAFAEGEAALRAKYPQYASVPLFAGEPMLLRIEIDRVVSWAASTAAVRAAEGEQP